MKKLQGEGAFGKLQRSQRCCHGHYAKWQPHDLTPLTEPDGHDKRLLGLSSVLRCMHTVLVLPTAAMLLFLTPAVPEAYSRAALLTLFA
jgi:hypothetical protein